MPRLSPAQQTAAALTAAACCGLVVGCSSATTAVAPGPTPQATSDIEYWEPTAEEDQMLLACAGEKLGYTYTFDDIVYPDMADGEGIIDTEEEWEGRRMIRAYEQCWFEHYPHPDELDMTTFDTLVQYNSAYGIRWGETEPHGDPLAPWPGEENLGWD